MQDTLLVWGSSFKINATSADDPIQIAIENQIKANICKTPIGRISLEGQVQDAVLSETNKAIADMAAKLQERRDRDQRRGGGDASNKQQQSDSSGSSASAAVDASPAAAAAAADNTSSTMTHIPSLNMAGGSYAAGTGASAGAGSSRLLPEQAPPAQLASQAGATAGQGQVISNTGNSASGSRDADKRDYAWFGGVHTDCNTIVYKAPLQGWNTLLPSSFAGSAPAGAQPGKSRPPSTLVNKKF